MDSKTLSSDSSKVPVRQTYRAKRKRDVSYVGADDSASESPSEAEPEEFISANKRQKSATPSKRSMKPPSTIGHQKSSSSLSAVRFKSKSPGPTPSSSALLKRFRKEGSPDSDSASVADSSAHGHTTTRRTEAQRIAYFKEDPTCGGVEPHRALCGPCGKWINLGQIRPYTVKPWENHRKKCTEGKDQATPNKSESVVDPDESGSVVNVEPASASGSPHVVRRTEAEREALLKADLNAERVEPDQVFCKNCQKWIKLSTKTRFTLGNWTHHTLRCTGALPSSRVAAAERKLKLVNDPRAKSFTAHSAECAACGENVSLGAESEYDLGVWEAHHAHCSKSASSPPSPSKSRAKKPAKRDTHSPASTDTTLIPSASSPSRSAKKRTRATKEEVPADSGERPTNRPRSENYVPPKKEPGPLGWFMAPFQTFWRGFQDGIKTGSVSAPPTASTTAPPTA